MLEVSFRTTLSHRRCTIDNATSAFTDEGDERASSPSLTGATGSNIRRTYSQVFPLSSSGEAEPRAAAAIEEETAQPHTHTYTSSVSDDDSPPQRKIIRPSPPPLLGVSTPLTCTCTGSKTRMQHEYTLKSYSTKIGRLPKLESLLPISCSYSSFDHL